MSVKSLYGEHKHFWEGIRKILDNRDLNPAWLSRETRIDPGQLSNAFKENSPPQEKTIKKVETALEIDVKKTPSGTWSFESQKEKKGNSKGVLNLSLAEKQDVLSDVADNLEKIVNGIRNVSNFSSKDMSDEEKDMLLTGAIIKINKISDDLIK